MMGKAFEAARQLSTRAAAVVAAIGGALAWFEARESRIAVDSWRSDILAERERDTAEGEDWDRMGWNWGYGWGDWATQGVFVHLLDWQSSDYRIQQRFKFRPLDT